MTKGLFKLNIRLMMTSIKVWLRWGLSKRGFWTRALLCWFFAVVLLKFDEMDSYDLRFKIRGTQKASSDIILVTIRPSDFVKIYDLKTNSLININESNDITDSFFWDQKIWFDLLRIILKDEPKSVGVTLFFGENIGSTRLNSQEIIVFKDPRITWATNVSEPEKASLPFSTLPDRSNIGHIDLLRDEDGIVRRLFVNPDHLPNIAQRVVAPFKPRLSTLPILNFRGDSVFEHVDLQTVLRSEAPDNIFKDKIVLIGVERTTTSQVLTPLGLMSRHQFWAQAADNMLAKRFIQKLPSSIYILWLLLLTFVAALIIMNYPQSISFFLFLWIATLWTAFSIWAFDTYSLWLPIVSPIALLVLIWVLFVGYQAIRIEQAHTQLQQEQRYIAELEQLKNNFVSLISHDLKTPIAKIQAVIDRLNVQKELPVDIQADFSNLRDYSEELNRYIQSILKVLRVESKDFKINTETADLNEVIETVVARVRPLAKSKSIEIKLELEPMFLIEFDVTLMTEVMLNLIENAIKYTAENGTVRIHTTETDTEVLVEVQDTGEGISQEDQEYIWKKFARGKNQDMKTKGSGLGLYLVKYFIELHGGKITLKSDLEKGTTFYVRLPIDPV